MERENGKKGTWENKTGVNAKWVKGRRREEGGGVEKGGEG